MKICVEFHAPVSLSAAERTYGSDWTGLRSILDEGKSILDGEKKHSGRVSEAFWAEGRSILDGGKKHSGRVSEAFWTGEEAFWTEGKAFWTEGKSILDGSQKHSGRREEAFWTGGRGILDGGKKHSGRVSEAFWTGLRSILDGGNKHSGRREKAFWTGGRSILDRGKKHSGQREEAFLTEGRSISCPHRESNVNSSAVQSFWLFRLHETYTTLHGVLYQKTNIHNILFFVSFSMYIMSLKVTLPFPFRFIHINRSSWWPCECLRCEKYWRRSVEFYDMSFGNGAGIAQSV
jgi:hypothetical protein